MGILRKRYSFTCFQFKWNPYLANLHQIQATFNAWVPRNSRVYLFMLASLTSMLFCCSLISCTSDRTLCKSSVQTLRSSVLTADTWNRYTHFTTNSACSLLQGECSQTAGRDQAPLKDQVRLQFLHGTKHHNCYRWQSLGQAATVWTKQDANENMRVALCTWRQ